MKKAILVMLSLLAIALLVVSCTPRESSSDEEAALAGEGVSVSNYVNKGDLFLLPVVDMATWTNQAATGEILEYKGADSTTQTNPKIKFKVLRTGETLEYSGLTGQAEIKLMGKTFKVALTSPTRQDSPLKLDFDADGRMDSPLSKNLKYKNLAGLWGRGIVCTYALELGVGETKPVLNLNANHNIKLTRMDSGSVNLLLDNQVNLSAGLGLSTGTNEMFITPISIFYQSYAGGIQKATLCINQRY